jgi:hypothetical protein
MDIVLLDMLASSPHWNISVSDVTIRGRGLLLYCDKGIV